MRCHALRSPRLRGTCAAWNRAVRRVAVTWGDMNFQKRSNSVFATTIAVVLAALAVRQLGPWAARAAADDTETIIVVDHAPGQAARDRDRALGDAPFVTVLHPDEHPAAA